jgi:para-aminobenzoate synthetase/4-amino-4-deoxychorismate lyase
VSVHALIRHADTGRWLAYTDPVAILEAADVSQVAGILREAETRARAEGLHAVGFLTYEAAAGLEPKLATYLPGVLPPAWFALFSEPGEAADPGRSCRAPLPWLPSLDAAGYRRNIDRIRDYIAAGDTYQVNFSYRLRASLEAAGPDAARQLFQSMISRQPAGLGAFIETGAWALCCASHELFFSRRGRRLTSRPMKGTAPRGATASEDARHASWLRESSKNRAENLMITDMVRNDIGRLADTGSVRTEALFQLEPYPTLWQMTSTVHGDTDASLAAILRALFPAASITGAPKRRTMEIIRELETGPREIYTGTVGLIRPDGDAQFNVAIRTALVDKRARTAEYGVGGGILWDSDPAEEHEETRTKARILGTAGAFGFSLLETLLWQPDGGFLLLQQHLDRLQAAARHFFCRAADPDHLSARLEALAASLPQRAHRVRLLLDERLDIQLSAAPLDPQDQPRRVALARAPSALLGNPFVMHKTTRREVYDAARRAVAVAVPDADDVLLINERGEVTESTIANLVVDLGGILVTPPCSCGLLPGVYRQHLLDTGRIVERVVRPEHLQAADAIYLANSVRGLWQVELIGA